MPNLKSFADLFISKYFYSLVGPKAIYLSIYLSINLSIYLSN